MSETVMRYERFPDVHAVGYGMLLALPCKLPLHLLYHFATRRFGGVRQQAARSRDVGFDCRKETLK